MYKLNKVFFHLVISAFVVLLFGSCTDPIGYPAKLRVHYDDDYSELLRNDAYSKEVSVTGIQIFKEKVSCGYAVIEMLAKWQNKPITEDTLSSGDCDIITTAIGSGFLREMHDQFPEWETTRCVNITNTELLKKIYTSLDNGFPVPIEFPSRNTPSEWVLHYGLVTLMDLGKNKVVVQNPHGGYEEIYTVDGFIRTARYESYRDMEWYFKAGFNMGIFNKNTIYIMRNKWEVRNAE